MLTLLSSLLVASLPTVQAVEEPRIAWWQGVLDGALRRAAAQRKHVVAYFWVAGSPHCESIWNRTLQTPEIASELADWLCVGVDVGSPAGGELVGRYGVTTLPTLLFLTADGAIDDAVVGYISVAGLAAEVQRIEAGRGTISNLRQRVQDDPDDLQRYLDLAVKLRDVGLGTESAETFAIVRRRDPDARTVAGARLGLWDAQDAVRATGADDPSQMTTAPVRTFLDGCAVPEIRFEGWQWVADLDREAGRRGDARKAIAAAWADVPDARVVEWGARQATFFWEARDELAPKEKKLALAMAAAAVAAAEREIAERQYGEEAWPGLAEGLNLVARLQLLNGQRREAKATIERCLELDPGGAEHLELLEQIAQR